MLEALRSFVGSWAAKILLVLLVGSFALWGIEGTILSGGDANTVARVGDTRVSAVEFLGTYNRALNETQQQLGRRLTREEARLFGIEARALGQVVSGAVLDEYARIHGLALSDDTLARLIAENPAFQDSSGKFNRENFRRAIYEAQMRETDFVNLQNDTAIRSQISEAFTTGQVLPEAFNAALTQFVGEERKFSHFTVTPEIAGKPEDPTAEQLKAYFEANTQKYRAPEYRKLIVFAIEPKDIADEASVTEAEIEADYEARSASYISPEKRRIQQIVFRSKEAADAAVKALQEGAIFETVLEENGVSVSDADLGLMEKTSVPKALQETAFSLPLNETSPVIDGPFGPTMIRVTEIEEERTTPLDEVKDQIRKDLALRRAADSIISMQETVEDSRAGGNSLEETAENLGQKARTIEAIDAEGRDMSGNLVPDVPGDQQLIAQAFQTEVGEQASPIDIGSAGYAWYDVVAVTPARDRTQDEVSEQLRNDWLADEQAKMVVAKAEELRNRIKAGEAIGEVAESVGQEVVETGYLTRNGSEETFPATATEAGFAGGKDHVSVAPAPSQSDRLVLSATDIKRPEAQANDAAENAARAVNQGAADDLLTQFVVKLQNEYEVTQNPALIDQLLSRN